MKFGNARDWLAASPEGTRLDGRAAPTAVFDRTVRGAWLPRLHKRLCGYAHSRAGTNNMDFWESNGPVHVWGLLDRIIAETRETMVLGMVLLRLGWPNFTLTCRAGISQLAATDLFAAGRPRDLRCLPPSRQHGDPVGGKPTPAPR